jgi:hypothetical protein
MQTKLGKIYGNYLGWVVNHTPDPSGRMRVQVFIPHLTNTLYEGWNKNLTDKAFRNPNELGSKTLKTLQQVLPWAECAMPIFGGATAMKANATTDIVNVNGGNSFQFSSAAAFGAAAGIPLNAGVDAVGPATEQIADMPDSTSESSNSSQPQLNPGEILLLDGVTVVNDQTGETIRVLTPGESPSADTDLPPLAPPAVPPLASPVDEAAEDPQAYMGLDSDTTGTGTTDPQAVNFNVDQRTRDQIGSMSNLSKPGSRYVSLDFNDNGAKAGSGARGGLIIIPDNATQQEVDAAKNYLSGLQNFMTQSGVSNYPLQAGGKYGPGIRTSSENGRGVGGIFHTEPFFWQDTAAFNAVKNNPSGYTQILASTLGSLPGTTFIPPHKQGGAGGAVDANTGLNERDFATQYLLGPLAALNGQTLDVATGTIADGTGTAPQQTSEDPTDMVQVNVAGNQGSQPDTTIAGNGSPNGFFSVPAYGAKVWVFFYDGDIQRPVYFASVVEPSAGQTT